MISSSPLGPWNYKGSILKNPGHFFQVGGNNHHSLFEYQGNWYIIYHAQTVAKDMGIPKGYRSPHINQVFFDDDGTIQEVIADYQGVSQHKTLNPYTRVQAETFAWGAGIMTKPVSDDEPWQRALTDIENGDWIALSQVDFGEKGPSAFSARVANIDASSVIELRLDEVDGKLIGLVDIPINDRKHDWIDVTADISGAEGVHDLYMVFRGKQEAKLFDFDYWQFIE
jgi:arabinoxylan arabinofuranohydrolase